MTDDDARFDRLFNRHAPAVHRFALRRGPAAIAEDVVSGTFLVAWRRLAEVPPDAELSWLLTTARWVLANELRGRARHGRLTERLAAEPELPQPDPAADVADADLVRSALARLSPMDQEALRLTEWDGLPPADCARVMGCSTATFAVRLHRARRRFAAAVQHLDPHLVEQDVSSR